MDALTLAAIDCRFAARAMAEESAPGDVGVACPFPGGFLAAVIDGLGHGPEARHAACRAAALLESHAGEPLLSLLPLCHAGLRGTRGAAVSLARFDVLRGTMTWLSVGNVAGFLLRADPRRLPRCEALVLRGGVIGSSLPNLTETVLAVARGDLLLLATDGVRDGFESGVDLGAPLDRLAEAILQRHARGTDDALVLAARYVGNGT